MADLTDIENALVNLAAVAVYPNDLTQLSIAGVNIRVFPGWPLPDNLDADLATSKVNVSIFPLNSMERNTNRFPADWKTTHINTPTLTLTVLNNTMTIDGTISMSQICVVVVNYIDYAYTVQPNDTLNTIAAYLAALIPGAISKSAVVTIHGAYSLMVRISTIGTSVRELKQQIVTNIL